MTVVEILQFLDQKNVLLSLADDELVVRGEEEALDESLLTLLSENKHTLIELIRSGHYVRATREEEGTIVVPPNGIPDECEAITPSMLPLVALTQDEIGRIVDSVPGGARNVQDIYPLAPLQEGFLFHHLTASEGDPYLTYRVLRLDSRSRLDAYLRALQAVVDRHDILRTAIVWEGLPAPVQVVLRHATVLVDEVAMDPASGNLAEQLCSRFDPRRHRLDVRRAPLIRVYVTPENDGRWLLLMLAHHLAGDHRAADIMQAEIRAHLLGRAEDLPPPLPFRNLVAHARMGVSEEEHEVFFRRLLGDVNEPTAPYGLLEGQGDVLDIEEAQVGLAPGLALRLRERARRLGVSAASLCHLAYGLVLARISGRDDVVFGTVLFGRMQGGDAVDRVVGPFINTLPIRIKVGDEGVEAGVRRTHALLGDLTRHEHASLALAQRCSAVTAPTPLFSAIFNFRHIGHAVDVDDTDTESLWEGIEGLYGKERTNYPVGLSVDDLGDAFNLTAQVQVGIGAMQVCRLMERALEQLVDALAHAPGTPLRRLDVLPTAERRLILEEWNATEMDYPRDQCIHTLFEAQAEKTPEAVALVDEERTLTYGELNARANQLSRLLIALEVRPGDRVATFLARSPELVIAEIAILKCGAAYVPLDQNAPPERHAFMIDDCRVKVVVTVAGLALPANEVLRVNLDIEAWRGYGTGNPPLPPETTSDTAAYVMYTSGSTGQPKGVVIPHRGIARLTLNNGCTHLDEGDCIALAANPAFDSSTFEVWAALLHGARLVPIPQSVLLDANALARTLRREKVTVLLMVTGLLSAYAEPLAEVFPQLRYLVTGGDVAVPRIFAQVLRNPPQHLLQSYGPTETTTFVTALDVTAVEEGAKSIPLGRAVSNTRIYILDNAKRPVPIGVTGEIYIGGDGIARGYWNRPELTAERFLEDPFSSAPNARIYKTGDLARWLPDGNIDFLGRNDTQVKIRGIRIELGEIEARLAEHPGVRETVVLAREDGTGEKRLVAYVVWKWAEAMDAEALRQHVKARLPEAMVPTAYVRMEALPLTANGKVDRRALPAPEDDAYATSAYEEPRGEIETLIAAIWAELLGLERISRHDNFFALGGHSLLAVSLMERMRRNGLRADVRTVLTTPTLSDLAAKVDRELGRIVVPPNQIPADCEAMMPSMLPLVELTQTEIDCIVGGVRGGARNVQDIYPLAPLQEGILFHHLMSNGGDPYLLSQMFRFESRTRLDDYLAACQRVIDRHDILRTSVAWEGLSNPVQVVWRNAPLPLEEVVLDPALGDVGRQLQDRFDPRHHRIDVRQAPLMRTCVAYDPTHDCWFLLLLAHHLAGDHSTLDVMQQEIQAYLLGGEPMLPAPLPFRNFVAQVRLGVSAQEHEAFFRRMLGDVAEPTAPFGLLEVRGDGSGITEADLEIGGDLSRRLRERARRLGVSAASLCHLAWALVLSRISGRDDVVFGTVLFGRMQGGEGTDRVMGMLINTLPLRIDAGTGSVEASVRQTHVLLADLMRHEHASLALAQRCSSVPAPTPLFSSLFNYRHLTGASREPTDDAKRAWAGIESLRGEERTNYPLVVSVNDLEERFSITAKVVEGIEPMRICEHMHTALARLVEALENAPETPLHSIDVLPAAERHQLLVTWNATTAGDPSECWIHEQFEASAEKTPDAVAVLHDGRAVTYRELNIRANQLAHYLREIGVVPDARVAVCVERGIEMVVALLAVLKAGGAYVPLDPAYPAERLAFMLEDCDPMAVITRGRLASSSAVPLLDLDDPAPPWAGRPGSNPDRSSVGLRPEHLAYVIYTSGSTGFPKGAGVVHGGLQNLLHWYLDETGITEADTVLVVTSYSFDLTQKNLFSPLLVGAKLLLASEPFDPAAIVAGLATQGVTMMNLTPSAFHALMECSTHGELSALRLVILGGEPIQPARLLELAEPRPDFMNGYGPTECTAVVAFHRLSRNLGDYRDRPVPLGRPIPKARLYILDAYLRPVPIGVVGEIHIGGVPVGRGYWNRPELTAEKFVRDPFYADPEARMYKTGDLGRYRSDGEVEYVGRSDFQIKIRGYRVELGEIEAWLREIPGVRDSVVIVREDNPGDKRLVAYYVASDEAPGVEGLRRHLSTRLPAYMVPVAYVRLDALPLTPSGKLNRNALPPPGGQAYAGTVYEEPRGEIETLIAGIWEDVLSLELVGRRADFFALGGHSLLTLRVVNRLRQAGIEASVADLFQHPTVEALAAKIAEGLPDFDHAAVPIRTTGRERPLFLIHELRGSLLYAHLLAPHVDAEIPIYGLPPVPVGESQLQTVEAMATRMIRMIRDVQPAGPYRFAGWCLGGILGYEIAAQLVGADEVVEFVGLLDSAYAPEGERPPAFVDEKGYLLGLLQTIAQEREDIRSAVDELTIVSSTMNFEEFVHCCEERAVLPDHLQALTAAEAKQVVSRDRMRSLANLRYVAHPVPVRLHLFAAQEERTASSLRGWDALVPEEQIALRVVAGNHHTMLKAPNIAALGRALSDAVRDGSRAAKVRRENAYGPLVVLRNARGAASPLICVPGAGANVASFAALADAMGDSRPIYGLQPRGLDGTSVPHSTVEAAARVNLDAIDQMRPDGPLHLIGHSFGGWVVFEMAQRLRAAGRPVASLTIVDSEEPADPDSTMEYDDIAATMSLVEVFEQIAERSLEIRASDLETRDETQRRDLLHQRLVKIGIMPGRSTPDVLRGPMRVFARCLRTQYTPAAGYADPVRLVLLKDAKLDDEANRLQHEQCVAGWKRWAPNSTVWHGPGNHMTAFDPPHVQVVADWLRRNL